MTTIVREGELCLHLTGTDFSESVRDPELAACRDMWTRTLPSEAPDVYRAEFLPMTSSAGLSMANAV